MRVEIETIISTLQENTDFCIYTHIKPDGDAVGSAFGLALALQKLGKKVCVRCQDPWPQKFQDLVEEFVPDIVKAVEEKAEVIKAYIVNKGMKEISLKLGELTDDERTIITSGCLINYYREH